MNALGRGRQYRHIINTEISQVMQHVHIDVPSKKWTLLLCVRSVRLSQKIRELELIDRTRSEAIRRKEEQKVKGEEQQWGKTLYSSVNIPTDATNKHCNTAYLRVEDNTRLHVMYAVYCIAWMMNHLFHWGKSQTLRSYPCCCWFSYNKPFNSSSPPKIMFACF